MATTYGHSYNDTMSASSAGDTVFGLAGNDRLSTAVSANLYGGIGND